MNLNELAGFREDCIAGLQDPTGAAKEGLLPPADTG
jgi:hypothetical protein